uniref:Putative ovule protein n=1 Tax=Solanum chacoense TaxID=4108 RepID=A0A0V0GI70_SOLCH
MQAYTTSLHFIHAAPIRCVTSSSISPFPWIRDPKYLISLLATICESSINFMPASCVTPFEYTPQMSLPLDRTKSSE